MKIQLELNYCDAGVFLNYWDTEHGKDICAKMLGDGQVDIDGEKTSINKFFNLVKASQKE